VQSIFQSELAALQQFVELLKREQSALIDIDVDQLIALSTEKSRQAEQLAKLGHQRAASLHDLGVENSRHSIEQWLATQPEATVKAWQSLLSTAGMAQQLNQTNGKLIESQLQHNQQALATLLNAVNQSAVYGADGQTIHLQGASQRSLGKG
jgi:flagella synthesis protein FlgN